jgi:hypothetical protein
MFRRLSAVAACCGLCLLALPATASAQWHFTPMAGVTFAGKTTIQDVENATGNVHPNFAIAVTFLTSGVFGVEGLAALTPGFLTDTGNIVDKSRTSAVMGNLVITVPRRWTEYSLRPFASGGLGLMRTTAEDKIGVLPVASNVAGLNIGGGAVGYFSKSTGIRFDVRYYSNLHGVDQGAIALGPVHIRYMTASVGVVIRR